MKKFILFAAFLFFAIIPVYANSINVSVDGSAIVFIDQEPVILDGRTLVPIRAVFEHIGFEILWNADTETVILLRGEEFIEISVGERIFVANGASRELDVPAQIINGRVLLPIRAVLESVGYGVGWDSATSTVLIYSEDAPPAENPPDPLPPEEIPPDPPVPPERLTIPNRRLTANEVEEWINEYNTLGGANEFEREVIRLVNIERAAAGLPPLAEDATLMMAARFKSQSMSDLEYFSHTSPVYGQFPGILRDIFNFPPQTMGENLAWGARTPEAVVEGWMNSPGHRENILNPNFTRIGVGFFENHWTQKFSA